MSKLIALFSLFYSITTYSAEHPIYNRIIDLKPDIDKRKAFDLSNQIYKCHKKTGLDKYILLSMYFQESSLDFNAKSKATGLLSKKGIKELENLIRKHSIVVNDFKLRSDLKKAIVKVIQDFGVTQINYKNVMRLCPNKSRLLSDIKYAVDCSCKLLSEIKSKYKHEKRWWSRYHSSTKKYRDRYEHMVLDRLLHIHPSFENVW